MARSGVGYAGFYAVSDQDLYPNFREYLQIELTEPIYASVRYAVSFHVSLADKFGLATGSLGAYFSQSHVYRENGDVLNVEPQIQSSDGFIFNDKTNWTEVRDTFNSRYGGERYMLIGNFRNDAESNVTFVDSGVTNMHAARSYYYLDDVSVIALDSIPDNIAEQEQLSFNLWPNPASDVLHIQSRMPFARLLMLDISGRAVAPPILPQGEERVRMDVVGIPPGLYLLEATDPEGRNAVKKMVVQ
ncbi:MAG: T9SS type A sorting domain-containing protein [Flavobacteriales bacterium]|nr:T9SS type A sorting domain-containing protein [Flavobacteriales bacterium]